jgi:hypothetical protein
MRTFVPATHVSASQRSQLPSSQRLRALADAALPNALRSFDPDMRV